MSSGADLLRSDLVLGDHLPRPRLATPRFRIQVRVLPGTNPGTGTAYHPTALPTVRPYALPGSGELHGLTRPLGSGTDLLCSDLVLGHHLPGPGLPVKYHLPGFYGQASP